MATFAAVDAWCDCKLQSYCKVNESTRHFPVIWLNKFRLDAVDLFGKLCPPSHVLYNVLNAYQTNINPGAARKPPLGKPPRNWCCGGLVTCDVRVSSHFLCIIFPCTGRWMQSPAVWESVNA